jgi:alkylhydroperoxidase family enzyme
MYCLRAFYINSDITMPRLTAVEMSNLTPEFAHALNHGVRTGVLSTTLPLQVWAHRPEAAAAWLNVLQTLQDTSLLSDRERELARLTIASISQCRACQIARKTDALSEQDIACLTTDTSRFSRREQLAMQFAELLAIDHSELDDAVYEDLRAHFSEAELAELHMYCGLMLAGGKLTYALQAYAEQRE